MIYGKDVAVEYPIMDLYDTGMMNAYLTAVKNEYERGIKEQEEFVSKYGDFISPFRKDVETWDRLTMDPIVQAYDEMQARGIDPLRSQEGRALLASIRRRVPRETLSQLRQSAAAGQEYLKNRAEMQVKGTYNPEFEDYILGGVSFNDHDTTQQGMWDRTSPNEYKGLRTLTDPWFEHRTAKYKGTKGAYDYYGYDEKDMQDVVNTQIQAFLASDYGKFFYDRAKKTALSTAIPGESDASINKRAYDILSNDIVNANKDYLMNDRKVNPIYLENLQHQHALARQRISAANRKPSSGTEKQQPYNYHQSSLIRGALSLIPGSKGYYTANGADASAAAASYNVKQAFIDWKADNTKKRGRLTDNYKNAFLEYTGKITEDPEVALARFGKTPNQYAVSRKTNTRQILLDKNDLKNIETTDTYVRNSLGYTGKHTNDAAHFNKYLKRGQNLTAAPTGRIFTKMDKNGRLVQYVQVNVYTSTLNHDPEDPNTVISINDKYLQQAYIPIQYTDAVPNNSLDTPIYPSQSMFSTADAQEARVQQYLGHTRVDKSQSVNSPW